jgi:hypothetical protein
MPRSRALAAARASASRTRRSFLPALKKPLASGKPTLFDVITDENAHTPITSFGDRFASPF